MTTSKERHPISIDLLRKFIHLIEKFANRNSDHSWPLLLIEVKSKKLKKDNGLLRYLALGILGFGIPRIPRYYS